MPFGKLDECECEGAPCGELEGEEQAMRARNPVLAATAALQAECREQDTAECCERERGAEARKEATGMFGAGCVLRAE
jgi:hypothetical protein